ncbi:TPA: trypsin-like peptidase domain-containing protein [Staphylococcus delphini]|nr:trypsin-like peptidase domain-containing protein [Staphylococcus delphini]HEC2147379.1 trypsin-like peptidase domain-containing protein [Staphylococcus delphini]HEC2150905.1 trypsin-like peptidase domain-containing protein [Staphylococcus delphini]HEC2160910.1 trypsin-like peptidase domain-containing protein [Staphylococcus delphini]HEC2168775.1 trypsin-like peptidase domain-containing protein [Staphylococcus delphini]
MKKLQLILLLSLACFLFFPINPTYAKKGTQVVVPDTVADPHSKYTAKYESADHSHCTAILISSTIALTAKHCGGDQPTSYNGTIYPGQSGLKTPFGYMNISSYIPHPDYDIAILKGTEKDQSKDYHYYIKSFKTPVTALSDQDLYGIMGLDIYSYGYPYKFSGYKQYRSDGSIYYYYKDVPFLHTSLPTYEGQSGSGAFLRDGRFIGIIITRTEKFEGNILPFTPKIADWVNENAN